MPFLPLTSDFVFTVLFNRSPAALADLIEAVRGTTPGCPVIMNPYSPGLIKEDKLSILDIKACDAGNFFNIEMQAYPQNFFPERSLFYWAKLFSAVLPKGENYSELKPVVSINFLTFSLFEIPSHHLIFHIMADDHPHIRLTEHLEIHFLELPKFTKNLPDLENRLDLWLYVIKNTKDLGEKEMTSIIERHPPMKETFGELELLSGDEQVRQEYERRLKNRLDYNSGLQGQYKKGLEEGKKEGKEEGKEEGRADVARQMAAEGMNSETIIRLTGLSADQLREKGVILTPF